MRIRYLFGVLLVAVGVAPLAPAQSTKSGPPEPPAAKAIFAGGCFWCVEEAFDMVPGVVATTSGYTGGRTKNPTYEEVSSGGFTLPRGSASRARPRFSSRG